MNNGLRDVGHGSRTRLVARAAGLLGRIVGAVARLFQRAGLTNQARALYDLKHHILRWALMRVQESAPHLEPSETPHTPPSRCAPLSVPVIWQFWWQGFDLAPPIVRLCVESVRQNFAGWHVVRLSRENLFDYVDIDPRIVRLMNEGRISLTHFSDFVRFRLLELHGGLWLDPTLLFLGGGTLPASDRGLISRRGSADAAHSNPSLQRWSAYYLGQTSDSNLSELWGHLYRSLVDHWLAVNHILDYHLIDYYISLAYDLDIDGARAAFDSLPFSEPQIHDLSTLTRPGSLPGLQTRLSADTWCFKMNWRSDFDLTIDGEPTVLGSLLADELGETR